MAPISKLIPFLFLTTLLLSLQANARDSQFFSKVTPLSNNNNNIKETEVPKTEGPVLNKPEQQPNFIPETENSYGLYGHETGLHPPSTTTNNAVPYTTTTTTTYQPYKTTTAEEDIANTKYSNNNNYYNFKKDSYNSNQNELSETRLTDTSYNNYFSNNKDAFGKQNELSDTKYTQGYNSKENQNNNNNNNGYYYNNNNNGYYYNNNNNNDAANNMYYKTKAVNNNYNGERQGLSDTRFMEGGKYFYNVNSDNWSNHRGYFGNNNVNSYENKNSMEGYQNQEVFEDDQEDFDP